MSKSDFAKLRLIFSGIPQNNPTNQTAQELVVSYFDGVHGGI